MQLGGKKQLLCFLMRMRLLSLLYRFLQFLLHFGAAQLSCDCGDGLLVDTRRDAEVNQRPGRLRLRG